MIQSHHGFRRGSCSVCSQVKKKEENKKEDDILGTPDNVTAINERTVL